jgi:hypothetical protein
MMKKNNFVFGALILIAALLFMACPGLLDPEEEYEVTVDTAIQNGKITATPQSGAEGTEITLTITPNNGYVLQEGSLKYTSDSGAAVPITGTKFSLPAANVTVTAVFEAVINYTVTVTDAVHGKIEAGIKSAPSGTPIEIRANPDPGYRLKELKANDKVIDVTGAAPWKITLTENVTLTAEFEAVPADTYTVTIDALEHGSVTATPQYGAAGTAITLAVIPDSGYVLQEGSLKYTHGSEPVLIEGTQFNLPAANVRVTAVFEAAPANTYTVSIATLQYGNITAAPQNGAEGTEITLTLSPDTGYVLKPGSLRYTYGGATVAITETKFKLPAENVTVTAEFVAVPYTVSIAALQHGSITAAPQSGAVGTEITLTVSPEAGYVLQAGSLEYTHGGAAVPITGTKFSLPAADVTVTAKFEAVPEGFYTVSIAALQHGSVTAAPQNGAEGTAITLTVSPEAGYELKEGSLKYTHGSDTVLIQGTQFDLPAANVTVTAEFVEKSSAQFVEAGIEALVSRNLNAAITAFESAYQRDKGNNEAVVYSSLAKLASIATDRNVRALVANRLGFANYPGTIDALISGGWMQDYTDEEKIYWYYDYEGNKSYRWYDPQNEWDAKFFERYGLTPKAGYYYQEQLQETKYTLISTERRDGELEQYYDDDNNFVRWYDYDFGGAYQGPGYYYQRSYTYVFVSGKQKYQPLSSYYDEDNHYVSWYDSGPDYENSDPGYYYAEDGNYVFVTEIQRDDTDRPIYYYDDKEGHSVYWSDSGYENHGPGYYYEVYNPGYVFVGRTKIEGPLDWYYDEDFGAYLTWHDSDPGWGGDWWTEPGYYWEQYDTYSLDSETLKYESRTEKMPGLSVPDWFKESGAYKDNLTSAGALQAYQWPLLFYANLVEKNQEGLNALLDDILSSVFGAAFEDAAGRFKDLPYDKSITVDEGLIEALGLTGVFEGDKIYIGRAELDLLFSAIRLFKASLEWVAAYDWNTDISFLRADWETLEIAKLSPKNLPFSNNFMKNRGNGMMDKSKADFDKALGDSIAAYDHLIGNTSKLPPAYIDEMKNFLWLKDGLTKLRAAIQSGGTFYAPADLPSGDVYTVTEADALLGVNLSKLFAPGQFAIDKLVETESGGKAPQFYAFDGETPQKIEGKAAMDALDESCYIGFKLTLSPVTEVVVKGLGDLKDQYMPLFPKAIGKDLFGLYHK